MKQNLLILLAALSVTHCIKNDGVISPAGFKFSKLSSITTGDLSDIKFASSQVGYIAGANSEVLKTSDGGATWQKQSTGLQDSFTSIHFISESQGFVAGATGTIGKTTNGGTSWQTLSATSPGNTNPIWDVFFVDTNTGFLTQGQAVYKTSDGGVSWTKKDLSGLAGSPALSLHFLDAQRGFLSTGDPGTLLKTTDGGATWTVVATNSSAITDVFFVTQTVGYYSDHNGGVSKTTDGGSTWVHQTTGVTQPLRAVHFATEKIGFASGDSGTVISTEDGGTTWKKEVSGASGFVEGVYMVSNNLAFLCSGAGAIIKCEK